MSLQVKRKIYIVNMQMSISLGPRQANLVLIASMRVAKVQASLRIRAVSPEPPLLAHTGSESRGTFRQKARSLAPLNGWACAVKICHNGMLEDTNSLDAAHCIFQGSICNDCLVMSFCGQCAVCQMARELDNMGL